MKKRTELISLSARLPVCDEDPVPLRRMESAGSKLKFWCFNSCAEVRFSGLEEEIKKRTMCRLALHVDLQTSDIKGILKNVLRGTALAC